MISNLILQDTINGIHNITKADLCIAEPDGKITAKGKGTAAIYVYAQNGVYDTVNVKVR